MNIQLKGNEMSYHTRKIDGNLYEKIFYEKRFIFVLKSDEKMCGCVEYNPIIIDSIIIDFDNKYEDISGMLYIGAKSYTQFSSTPNNLTVNLSNHKLEISQQQCFGVELTTTDFHCNKKYMCHCVEQ